MTLKSAVAESTKKSPKYAVNVFEVKKVTSRLLIFSLRKFEPIHFIK